MDKSENIFSVILDKDLKFEEIIYV